MKKVSAIIRPERLDSVQSLLEQSGFSGYTVADVRGHGQSPAAKGEWRGATYELHVAHKLSIEVIVDDDEVDACVRVVIAAATTGSVGDGLVTVTPLEAVFSIRAGLPGAVTA